MSLSSSISNASLNVAKITFSDGTSVSSVNPAISGLAVLNPTTTQIWGNLTIDDITNQFEDRVIFNERVDANNDIFVAGSLVIVDPTGKLEFDIDGSIQTTAFNDVSEVITNLAPTTSPYTIALPSYKNVQRIYFRQTSSITVILPSIPALPNGTTIIIANLGVGNVTVDTTGGADIFQNTKGSVASVILPPNTTTPVPPLIVDPFMLTFVYVESEDEWLAY
jgi:hypothetical protein